ncbi:MAG TPA: fatty acid--CoA ligase family protein [Mycobacterium sp.]|nr:fatty acid--CoA ligase family protein [Mycobacterium sp.]
MSAFLFDHPADPDDAIAYWFDGQLTRAAMQHAAERVAETLCESGISDSQPVAHIVESGATALSVMFGCWLAGAVYVPVNGRLTESEINAQIAATQPAAVVARSGRHTDDTVAWVLHTPDWGWVGRPAARPWHGERLPAGTALVMRTSGTTGAAKPILLRHDAVAEGIDTVLSSLRAKHADDARPARAAMPNLIPTSLALWAGIWNVLFALRAGSPVVLMDRFDTTQFAALVRRHHIRSTILAPAMMAMLTEDAGVDDLAPLTMVRSVTAPLTPHQARAFKAKFGVGIMNCYGQTELGGEVVGWTAKDLREHGENKLGSVGRPHRGIHIRVLDDAGEDLATGQVGEIWIRSPFATRDASVSERLHGGYLRTGDIGHLDADGFLWLEGRASDVINRGGLKVLPHEIEEQLCQRPEVAEACVAGVPDERLGEVPVAWVRPAPGASVEPAEVLTALRATLAGYKVPVHIELVSELPRNEIGKVLRRTLVDQWTARHDSAHEGAT